MFIEELTQMFVEPVIKYSIFNQLSYIVVIPIPAVLPAVPQPSVAVFYSAEALLSQPLVPSAAGHTSLSCIYTSSNTSLTHSAVTKTHINIIYEYNSKE